MRLQKRIAIVTGGGRGIGGGIAQRFAREGARVALADINMDAAQRAAREIGSSAFAIKVDVSDRNSVEQMVTTVEKQLGPVDILVNNAGVSEVVPFLELDEATWDKHLDINLKGTFLCSQAVLKRMVRRRSGKIINISSQSGKKGNIQFEAYCASKFGVIGLTQSMALEFAPYKINVNAVCPGVVWTPMWDEMAPQYAAKHNIPVNRVKEYIISRIPLARLCRIEDVAAVAVFLASKDADYLTGQAINVTGGAIMH